MTFSVDAIEQNGNLAQGAIEITNESFEELERTLLDQRLQLAARFRALFTLKALKSPKAIEIIAKGNQFRWGILTSNWSLD